MRIGLKIIGGMMVLVIAVVVAIGATLLSMDYGQFKTDLAKVVQDATGRDFTINGDLSLALWPNPKLMVTDVTLANASWGRDGPMMTFKRLDAQVALRPLLSGFLDVDYIVLDGVELVLQTDGQGKANWEFTPAAAPSTLTGQLAIKGETNGPVRKLQFTPHVRDVRLRDVHVTYIDGATGAEVVTDLKRANFTAEHMDSQIKGTFDAIYNGIDVEAQAELGSFAQLIGTSGAAFPVNLKLSAPGLSADIVGSVDQPSAGMAIKARINAQAENTQTLSALVGETLPKLGRIDFRTNLSGSGTTYRFEGVEAQFANSDVTGNADVNLSGARPRVKAKLSSALFDVKALMAMNADASDDDVARERVFTTEPLAFDVLHRMDADADISVKRVVLDTITLTNANAGLRLLGGKLSLNPLRLNVDDGLLTARIVVDASLETPKVDVRASARGLDAGKIAAMAGQGRIVTMDVDAEVDVKSAGASTQALAGALSGYVRLIGRDGHINDDLFKDVTTGIGSIMPWASNKDANTISCFLAKLPIANGNTVAETVLLDTSGVLVRVTGNVDLAGERLHLTVTTKAKKTSFASFAVPIRIKGALLAPRTDVDPGEALVGTVGNIVKAPAKLITGLLSETLSLVQGEQAIKDATAKNDPCVQALSGGKTADGPVTRSQTSTPSPGGETPKTLQDPSKSSGDPLKDVERVGEALKKLF